MPPSILSYDPQYYDSLPEIEEADALFTERWSTDSLAAKVGHVFTKHGVQDDFGLSLLHRHFDMDPAEILVNIENVAVPWHTASMNPQLANVMGSSWRIVSDGLAPIEFHYTNDTIRANIEDHLDFVNELASVLQELALDKVLGVCAFNGVDDNDEPSVEFASGRANITLPMDVAEHEESVMIDTAFAFRDEKGTHTYLSKVHHFELLTHLSDSSGIITVKARCKLKCKGTTHVKKHLKT